MSLALILIATVCAGSSGLPGLFLGRTPGRGQRLATVLMGIAAALGIAGAGIVLCGAPEASVRVSWLPLGVARLAADALSAFFLVPVFLMGFLGSLYGEGYWRAAEHPDNARRVAAFWGLLVSGMALLIVARHAVVFLMGWEVMALSAFFLISAEDHLAEVRAAGWIYLVATHLATLLLFALFVVMRAVSGSFELGPLAPDRAGLGALTAVFLLAAFGFGIKAGIMPLHFWLPGAHANAPSHVSAMLSGVMIKMGIYGLVRISGWIPDPPIAWGALLMLFGALSGLLGVAYALGQHDLKRLLAYHSVENIGIILLGLAVAMVGRSLGRPDWIALGMAGCLLHVWNHGLFKSLLFLAAGSVVHATHTRRIDQLGGLGKTMPWTARMFLVGAIAICGLPPLNGFISELLIYAGLLFMTGLEAGPSWTAGAIAVPILAAIGALALACFVKVFGVAFLGKSRTSAAARASESPASMILPMAILAAGCAAIGIAPFTVAPLLDRAVAAWAGDASIAPIASLLPLGPIGVLSAALLVLAGGGSVLLGRRLSPRIEAQAPIETWSCGYARPASSMQYTASSFAQMLLGLLRAVLRPKRRDPHVQGIFAAPSRFASHLDDFVLDGQILPAARLAQRWLVRLRRLQQGIVQHYVLYIVAIVIALLIWTMPLHEMLARLFAR